VEAEIYPPAAYGQLRAADASLNGLALLGLQLDLWPGANELFDRYSAGGQVTIASELRLGLSREQPSAVLKISSAEVASLMQIGLVANQHKEMLSLMSEHRRVGLMRVDEFNELPETGLDPELQKSILIVNLRLPADFVDWLNASQ
jgi:hypothetical protein